MRSQVTLSWADSHEWRAMALETDPYSFHELAVESSLATGDVTWTVRRIEVPHVICKG
jgi:hypothetical protein